ncbi:sugar transferase [Hydrogenimonas cancrithermarum]|uniref:Bacterial sugar transferase domain-containing protein n=1 Tax=Hydrogenimonas cancrithermarum TaxID=2993563 RepID=A0ABM8FM33_9BACT|nr:sugar transferase [Hydrogenimonas cancrithermarum]BDY13411.1 hypothetical protein HCR_17230 [Hydrogenimonas cancrithermarum]
MIILGEKYILTELERKRLAKKFSKIEYIKYRNGDVEEIIGKIEKALDGNGPKLIVLNTKAPTPNRLIAYLTNLELKGVSFVSIEHFLESYLHKCFISEDRTDLTYLENIKPYTPWQYFQKRAVDFFGIFWLFFFSWPFMLYSAYRIKKESPDGPIFFKQKRVGFGGKEFECIKFRSMVPDAEKGTPKFASKDDPRIFEWGAVMRKTRLDELPQMWNILKGEMHLIGPRPERKYWTDQFEKIIPYYNERHLVKPGVTGWAQVMYPYGSHHEDAKQKLMYDLYYIKYWNIILELKIVWMTAMTVIGKKGI